MLVRLPFVLHERGTPGPACKHLIGDRTVHTRPLREHESLGQGDIQPMDQGVDGELGRRARSTLSGLDDPVRQRIEHRPGRLHGGGVTADHDGQGAFFDGADAPGDRSVEKHRSGCVHRGADLEHHFGVDGAHLHHHRLRAEPGYHTVLTEVHRSRRGVISEAAQGEVGLRHRVCRRFGDNGRDRVCDALCLFGIPIPEHQLEARATQRARHGATHPATAQNGDFPNLH